MIIKIKLNQKLTNEQVESIRQEGFEFCATQKTLTVTLPDDSDISFFEQYGVVISAIADNGDNIDMTIPRLTPVQFFKYLYIAKGIKDTDIQALIADNITDEQQKYFALLEFSREKVILRTHWLVEMLASSPLINMTAEEVDQAFYEASLL